MRFDCPELLLSDQTCAAPTALQTNFIRNQGRRALKNGHLPLAVIVRAFSALLERCNQSRSVISSQYLCGFEKSETIYEMASSLFAKGNTSTGSILTADLSASVNYAACIRRVIERYCQN
jgi:hypothetical protein